jgi:hypothetical protein
MLKIRLFALSLIACATISGALGQGRVVLSVTQPDPLVADAGPDRTFSPGDTVYLGAYPSASQGYGGYFYQWEPADGLDDPNSPNPVATPAVTTTYFLTVMDSNGCSASDEVRLTAGASGVDWLTGKAVVSCYPNPVSGDLTVNLDGRTGPCYIRLLNAVGSTVRCVATPGDREVLSLCDLPDGIYHLQVFFGKESYHQRIIKTGSHE